jgi:hypothetical protein
LRAKMQREKMLLTSTCYVTVILSQWRLWGSWLKVAMAEVTTAGIVAKTFKKITSI